MRGRAGSYQQHVQLATLQAIQGGKALGDQILVGRQAVVGQGFPVGQPGDGQCGRKPGDFCGKTAAVGRLRAYNDAGLSRDKKSSMFRFSVARRLSRFWCRNGVKRSLSVAV